ncbi:pre-toxin TG domain-containing protein [Parageobacillus sp. KH3-4]|uniref:pre-toxin TG domain-containing protein n=1 Tax=Parageobacillus sp. KH3-4 TaxID=2916802 RepID=UPI001FCAE094|nr:pre-toxin TG domain-containing protein [Parageobacillus sp. KH3-4]BDG45874.1 hypothetical protein PspKH34_04350 [Parageobacillus sp. KH3-4]
MAGLELVGWYDVQRMFGEYDPVTEERLSFGDRLFAGGMLLLSVIPPAKGAGVAGKAAVKGAKAAGTTAEVSKWISKTKNVLNVDKIKGALQTIYHQVIKGPITETIRSFKHQWENFLENVGSVLRGPQLAADGVGVVPSGRMIGIAEESASSVRISMSQAGDEVVGKGIGKGKNESPRNKPGVVSESFKFDRSLQKQTKLMYNKGAIGIIPKEIRDKLVGKKFNSFDDFRKEFWKCVANSSYAKEFRSRNIARMLEGNAPIAPKAEHYGKLKSYILHHKQPIEKGGEVYNLDNLIITSPRMHQIILDPAYHFGKKG